MARVASGPVPRNRTSPHAAPPRPRDRRQGSRQPLEVLGVLTAASAPDKPLEVAVLNVSLTGCAFRSPVAFRPGAIYTLRIGTGPLHLTSTLRIISSRDCPDGRHDVGARFV
jgi:hypothetical protein